MDANEALAHVIGILSAALIYFVPALIAKRRHIENLEAIFLVNLVFGWTVLGWIGALIWSIIEKQKVKESIESPYVPIVAVPKVPQQDKPLAISSSSPTD